ncbi:MAG: phosphopantothenoylcysteine decarboxylase, partial [Bacteroidales bacterium]
KLKATQDILASLGASKKEGQFLVGFALETQNEIANAQKKLLAKNADLIVLNSLQDPGAGFGTPTNKVTFLSKEGDCVSMPLKSKEEVALDLSTLISQKI